MRARVMLLAIACAYARVEAQTPVADLFKEAASRPAMAMREFEEMALSHNPTLEEANAMARRSAGEARQAGLPPNLSAGYQGEQIRGGSFGGGEQGAFAQQTFVLGGKLALRRNVYEQQRRADEMGAAEQRQRVLSDVDRSFYAALAAQESVRVRRQLLELATDAMETARQLANVGQADAPDVLEAEVEKDQAEVDSEAAQRRYIEEFHSLAALAGQPALPLARVTGDLDHLPPFDERTIDVIVRDSPAVKRAQQQVARAEAELKSARRESVPDLQIRAGVQQNFERLDSLGSTPVGAQGFATAGVTLPIFNRNQGNVAAANAEVERTRAEAARIQLLLRQRAQALLQTYFSDEMEASRYKTEMIPRATRAYQLYLDKYRQMAAAYAQVIISQRTLFQLQAAYVGTLARLWQSAIALENYTLTDGLSAPMPSGSAMQANLPGSGSNGAP